MLKEALSKMATVFSPNVLIQGETYQQKGNVLSIRLSDGLLKARVKGNMGRIYDVHIDLKTWPNTPSRCGCQMARNCKHTAASLFALQVKENLSIPAPANAAGNEGLKEWIQTLREHQETVKSPLTTHQVIYFLEPISGTHEDKCILRLALAKRLKRGGLGQTILFNTVNEQRRQFFSADDEQIMKTLTQKTGVNAWFDRLVVRNSELLEKILLTQRAYLFNKDSELQTNHLLKMDTEKDACHVNFKWQLGIDGYQRLSLTSKDREVQPLFLDMPWYYDEVELAIGRVQTMCSSSRLKFLMSMPPLSLAEAPSTLTAMEDLPEDMPRPKEFQQVKKEVLHPAPILSLNAVSIARKDPDDQQEYLWLASFIFQYREIRVLSSLNARQDASQLSSLFISEGNTLIEIPRSFKEEAEWQEACMQLLPMRGATLKEKLAVEKTLDKEWVVIQKGKEEDVSRLHEKVIPDLQKKGWEVLLNHPALSEVLSPDDLDWYSELEDTGHDFFAYQLGILIEGKQVSIVPLVIELISQMNKNELEDLPDDAVFFLPLPGTKRLKVSMSRIRPLIRFLLHYGSRFIDGDRALEISRYQLMLMQETEQAIAATAIRWQKGEIFRQQLQQLLSMKDFKEVELPKGLNATLRTYQHQGVNWLQFLRESRFGGVLADDMGLGKTVQTLAHLQLEKEEGRLNQASLIVAPTSLVGNWFEEAKRFTPELKVLIFHGAERHQDDFSAYDVVISTYGLIQRDKSRFIEYPFYYLILDEAQSIKNARAKTTQVIQQIRASHRLCLSGTPLENHLGELWSLFHFLMPGLLGDAKQFRQFFKLPIEKEGNDERRVLLAKRVRPFMLRRTKNQVARELPPKTETTQKIEISGSQRDLYEAIRMSMEKKVRTAIAQNGIAKSHIVFLDALLKLRQVCCDPRLLAIQEAKIAHGESAKLDALMTLLDSLVAENRRVLVFSQFTSMLKLIEEQLVAKHYRYLKLTGQSQNRQALVNSFQEGNTPIFLISLKAGGTGLNLTRADTVIHYDPWWNPAVEDQATDRTHRIGQENPVFVYKLITSGSVEEVILTMQERKRQLFQGILSDNLETMKALTVDDLEQFFKPLVDLP